MPIDTDQIIPDRHEVLGTSIDRQSGEYILFTKGAFYVWYK